MKKISAVIITYNESANIEQVIRSVQWCDEIIIVDSESSDDTVSKAESLGARVITREFNGYGAQKGFAVLSAKNNWVLSVDADEEVSEELRNAIGALPEECRMSGYHLTRIDRFNGKILKYSLGGRGSVIRLFDKRRGNFNDKTMHEAVEIEGRTGKLKGNLYHDSCRSITLYLDKLNRYTSMMAQQKYDQGHRATLMGIVGRFPFALVDAVFLKRGFLDGYEGVLVGILNSMKEVVESAKLREIEIRLKS